YYPPPRTPLLPPYTPLLRSGAVAPRTAAETRTETPLPLLFAPLCTALVLIAVGAILDVAEVHIPVIEFLSTPVVALLIGLVGTKIGRAHAELQSRENLVCRL